MSFFSPKCQINFITRCFDEVDFFPPKTRFSFIVQFFDGVDNFSPKSWLSYLDACMRANVFFPAKKSNTLNPPEFSWSWLFPDKKSITRFFDGVNFIFPKTRLSYLYPCISANVHFRAKKLITFYPVVFWRSRLFPVKKSITRFFDGVNFIFAKNSTLLFRPVYKCKQLFSRQKNKYTLSPGFLKK